MLNAASPSSKLQIAEAFIEWQLRRIPNSRSFLLPFTLSHPKRYFDPFRITLSQTDEKEETEAFAVVKRFSEPPFSIHLHQYTSQVCTSNGAFTHCIGPASHSPQRVCVEKAATKTDPAVRCRVARF